MTQLINGEKHRNRESFAITFLTLIATIAVLSSCQKDATLQDEMPSQISNATALDNANPVALYRNLTAKTRGELQQARVATAKYQDFNNAIADGYININVEVPGMGHHYMNIALKNDGVFDHRKPEILVYDHREDGTKELVAIEYAIPLGASASAPSGFSGNLDEWSANSVFGLWLLHAWVWKYNPAGVFNPTNPTVHQH